MSALWTPTDFKLNRLFWSGWDLDTQLPFRIRNLSDITAVIAASGIPHGVSGTGRRQYQEFGEFRKDHDDDIDLDCSKQRFLSDVLPHLRSIGFRLIRNDPTMISVLRFGRYTDIHFTEGIKVFEARIHGALLSFVAEPNLQEMTTPLEKRLGSSLSYRRVAKTLRHLRSNPRALRTIVSEKLGIPKERRSGGTKTKNRKVDEEEFLKLKIDADDSINWDWRYNHLAPIVKKGMNFQNVIDNFLSNGFMEAIREADLSVAINEPVNYSREFWKNGNNFFAHPFQYGFRHLAMPYQSANIYINSRLAPNLYTRDYYLSLVKMTDAEIENFLASRPIEITGDALTSGRHRAIAMAGRIAKGESYIQVSANFI